MSNYCSDLNPEAMEQAQEYYQKLLSSVASNYNSAHKFIYQLLCALGVFANVCIIVVLLRPSMRKNPFNLFLIAIAVCDMTLMASYFAYKKVDMCHPWYFSYAWIIFTYAYAVLSVFVHSTSLWVTVNMAVLRYLVLRNSSSSSSSMPRLNTYSAATVSILAAVVISLVGSTPNMLRYQIYDNGFVPMPQICYTSQYAHLYGPNHTVQAYFLNQPKFWNCAWERVTFWTTGVLLKLLPCILLTVFMMLLVRMLVEARERRARLAGSGRGRAGGKAAPTPAGAPSVTVANGSGGAGSGSGSGSGKSSQAERTTAMLTTIVAVFLITELPQGILVVAIGIKPEIRFAMAILGNAIDLLSLLNSSVNFILYSTMSNLFRNEFLQTFGHCCPRFVCHCGDGGLTKSGQGNGTPTIMTTAPTKTPSVLLRANTTDRIGTDGSALGGLKASRGSVTRRQASLNNLNISSSNNNNSDTTTTKTLVYRGVASPGKGIANLSCQESEEHEQLLKKQKNGAAT